MEVRLPRNPDFISAEKAKDPGSRGWGLTGMLNAALVLLARSW